MGARPVGAGDPGAIDAKIIRQLGQLGRRYDAGDLRRFAKPKRDALVACYLIEARKPLLDHLVEMNDQFLTGMNRRARNTVKVNEPGLRRRARVGMDRVLGAIDALAGTDIVCVHVEATDEASHEGNAASKVRAEGFAKAVSAAGDPDPGALARHADVRPHPQPSRAIVDLISPG